MAVLRIRNFAVLYIGQLLSTIGNHLFTVALLWYVLVRTGSRLDVSLVGVAQTLPGVAALFTGVFVDRWRKRQTMIASDALRAVMAGLLAFLVASGNGSLAIILALVLLLELVGTFFRPASSAFLPEIVPSEQLAGASGMLQSSSAFAQLVGLLGGGLLVGVVGAAAVLSLNAVSFVASIISVALVRVREEVQSASKRRAFFVEWFEGIRAIAASRFLLRIIAAAIATNFALAPVDVLLPVWVRQRLHGGPGELGLLMGAALAGMLAGGITLGGAAKRWELKSVLLATFLVMGVSLGSVALVPMLGPDALALFVMGAGAGGATGALGGLMLQTVPAQSRGRIFGTLNALTTIATPLGIGLAGALTKIYLPGVFAIMGAIVLVTGLSFALPVKNDLAAMEA